MRNRVLYSRLTAQLWTILCLFMVVCSQTTVLASDPQNFLTIREMQGRSTIDYPVQIGRPFVQGEIPHYPQAVIGGLPTLTQADVKTRWPDGSVKHAVVSFLIPELKANSNVTITFQDQSSGNNNGFLDQQNMFSSKFNFDASINLTNDSGISKSASARKMLQDGNFEYWLQGQVLTSVIIADHSEGRLYDIGFDAYRSFRPIFHATFWPTINKVRVRYIGEASHTEALQDMAYSLQLNLGYNPTASVYTKASIAHHSASRWTKEFWIGGSPSNIAINHNLAYLAKTRLIPNYDVSKIVSESTIASEYTAWNNSAKDLFDPGLWSKPMGNPGGRRDIGPYPTWTVRWLYTGDRRMEEMALGHADLAAAWPMHFREGKTDKYFDRAKMVPGIGKPISISGRPTIHLGSNNSYIDYSYTKPEDKITPVGSFTNDSWKPDGAHQPDAFSPQYTLSGDFWYLEEMYFWTSWSAAKGNGAATIYAYGRGPTGAEGGIPDEIRGQAWIFRSRAHTATLAPDGTPEKAYFKTLIDDAIAIWEGMRNITGTSFEDNANWNWGYSMINKKYGGLGVPPLRHWERGSSGFVQEMLDPAIAKDAISTWEQNFLIFALGRARELGYPTDALIAWVAPNLVNQLIHPGYNPYLMMAYRVATTSVSTSNYFTTWAGVKSAVLSSYDPEAHFLSDNETAEHGYKFVSMCATSMVANEPGGLQAWAWVWEKVLPNAKLNNNPKWAIVPRDPNSIKPQAPSALKATEIKQ